MKKILIMFMLLPMLAFADDCANAYKAGLDMYKQGEYAEAQLKFIAVAIYCKDYADVWNKIKSCNQKLTENQSQQSAQISSLKAEIHGLQQVTSQSHNNVSSATLSKEALDVVKNINAIKTEAQQNKEHLKIANDSIASLNRHLVETNDTIFVLRKEIESLKNEVEELNKTTPVSVEKEKASSNKKTKKQKKSPTKSSQKNNKAGKNKNN